MSNTATITGIDAYEKMTLVTLSSEGKTTKVRMWNDAGFASEIKQGAEITFSVELKDSKKVDEEGNPYKDKWFTEVNGKPAKAQRGPGGGGGRPAAQPKDEASIAAQVILKEAMNGAIASNPGKPVGVDQLRNLARELASAYIEAYKAVKGAHGA